MLLAALLLAGGLVLAGGSTTSPTRADDLPDCGCVSDYAFSPARGNVVGNPWRFNEQTVITGNTLSRHLSITEAANPDTVVWSAVVVSQNDPLQGVSWSSNFDKFAFPTQVQQGAPVVWYYGDLSAAPGSVPVHTLSLVDSTSSFVLFGSDDSCNDDLAFVQNSGGSTTVRVDIFNAQTGQEIAGGSVETGGNPVSLAFHAGSYQVQAGTAVVDLAAVCQIKQTPQTIHLVQPGDLPYGGEEPLDASATSGLPVTFGTATPDVCTWDGFDLRAVGLGECRVTASQSGGPTDSHTYWGPASAAAVLNVGKAPMFVTAQDVEVDADDPDPQPAPVYSTAFQFDDGPTDIDTQPTCAPDWTSWTTTCAGGSDDHYDFEYVPGQISVLPEVRLVAVAEHDTVALTARLSAPHLSAFSGRMRFQTENEQTIDEINVDADGSATVTVPLADLPTDDDGHLLAVEARYRGTDPAGVPHVWPAVSAPVAITAPDATDQTIAFPAPGGLTYGGTESLHATASSGLTVTYTAAPAAVCRVDGDQLTAVGVGTCTVTASQAGDATHQPASQQALVLVGAAPLLVAADGVTITASTPDPVVTASYTGFVLGDTHLATAPSCAADLVTWTTSCSGGSDDHYALSYASGRIDVQPDLTLIDTVTPDSVTLSAHLYAPHLISYSGRVEFFDGNRSLGDRSVAADGTSAITVSRSDLVGPLTAHYSGSPGTPDVREATSAPIPGVFGGEQVSPTPVLSDPTPAVGERVTVLSGPWLPPATLAYQWYADGRPILRATGATLVVGRALLRKRLQVEVSGTREGTTLATVRSVSSRPVRRGTLAAARPTIIGHPRVGRTLRLATGQWTPGTRLKFQWYAAGHKIRGAHRRVLRVAAALRGKRITVRVSGRKAGYRPATRASVRTRPVRGR